MTADRFWDLLSKKISAEASEDELTELETLLNSHPDWRETAETLNNLWQQPNFTSDDEAREAFKIHIQRIKEFGVEFNDHSENPSDTIVTGTNASRRRGRMWLIASGVLAVLIIGFIVIKNPRSTASAIPAKAEPVSQVMTKSGSRTQIQLPDGSTVWLNASSNLTYDKNFGNSLREVNLTGEAFFDVVKDASHPFIIHTKVIDVKVLGTQFNVKAYPNDAYTEASLIRGSVEVTIKNRPNEKHYLKPNEKVSVANNIDQAPEKTVRTKPLISTEGLTYYHADNTIIETSWVDNRLIFQENETFRDVAKKMERWFGGISITFADDEVGDYRIYGSFTDETVTQALDALREAFKFNYKINANNIVIAK